MSLNYLISHKYIVLYITILLIVGTAYFRYSGRDFRRYLFGDELITLEHYTWAGVKTSGEQFRIRRAGDFETLPRPSFRQMAMGLYCSLGRWTEPNNHCLNSLLINGALALNPRDYAASARLPALFGAAVFALLLGKASADLFQLWSLSILLVFAALWHPYFLYYSQAARGYSLMVSLQMGWILALVSLVRKPTSITLGTVCALLAILTYVNIINLAVDWVLPAYLAAYVFPPHPWQHGMQEEIHWKSLGKSQFRKNLLVQGIAITFFGSFLLVDRLPYIFSSMQQYGVPAGTMVQWRSGLLGIVNELFPGLGWKIFAGLGLLGLLLPGKDRRLQWVTVLTIMTCGISLLHFILARKLPYGRVAGYFLPLVFLGIGNDARIILSRCPRLRSRVVAWVTLSACLATLTWPSFGMTMIQPEFAQLLDKVKQEKCPEGVYCYPLFATDIDPLDIMKYLPDNWLDFYDKIPARKQVILSAFFRGTGDQGMEVHGDGGEMRRWNLESWPSTSRLIQSGSYRVVSLRGTTEPFRPEILSKDRAAILWYPDPQSMAVTPEPVLSMVKSSGIRYLVLPIRQQVKLDVFGRVNCVVLVIDTPRDWDLARKCVSEGIRRFGGDAVLFVPS